MAEKEIGTLVINIQARLDKLESGLKTAEARVNQSNTKMISSFKSVASAMGVAFSAAAVIGFAKKSIDAYAEQEKANKKLETALGRTSKALLDNANAIQFQSTFADEQIVESNARFAMYIKDEKMIKDLTKATMDFAVAQGMDLVSASDMVVRTFMGQQNSLGRLKLNITGASGSQERFNSLTKEMNRLWSGQDLAQASTEAGKLANQLKKIDELAEDLGGKLLPLITDFGDNLKELTDGPLKFFEKDLIRIQKLASRPWGFTWSSPGTLQGTVDGLKKDRASLNNAMNKGTTNPWASEVDKIRVKIKKLTDDNEQAGISLEQLHKNLREIDKLQTQLTPKIKTQTDLETEANKILDKTINKIEGELILADLLNKSKLELLLKSKENLDAILKGNVTEGQKLKILQEQKQIAGEIKQIQDDMRKGTFTPLPSAKGRGERIELQKERIPALVEVYEVMQQKRIEAITNEFEKRKAEINGEVNFYLEKYSEAEGIRLGLETEYADARFAIEQARIIELRKLEQQNLSAQLDQVSNIGNALENAFSKSGDSLLSKLNQALQIAVNIAKAMNSEEEGALGFLGKIASIIPGIGFLLSLHKGGTVTNTGGAVSYIPKFATGTNFTVPQGYPNDSFPMRVESGERVQVTPASQAADYGIGKGDIMLVVNAIKAMNMNLIQQGKPKITVINKSKDIRTVVLDQNKVQDRMLREGKNINE